MMARGRSGASFVARVVMPALLARDVAEAIVAGKPPASQTVKELMAPFPVE